MSVIIISLLIYNKYKLIFADPPYNSFEPKELIENINNQNILDINGLLIIEHSKHTDLSNLKQFVRSKSYGGNVFSFFENEASDEEE